MIRLRSLVQIVLVYGLMGVMGIVGLPLVLWSRDLTYRWMKGYCHLTFWLTRHICGLKTEIRGTVPQGPVVVAAKHQSLLDVLMIFSALPRAKFVMKRSLLWAPVFGLYNWRIGTVAIDRSARGQGAKILGEIGRQRGEAGQVVIYPQGTRIPPGVSAPYRTGAAMIYERARLPLVMVATNAGWFWPRRGILRRPGTAVVEFLETLPAGLPPRELMSRIEGRIEAASDALGAEAARQLASLPAELRAGLPERAPHQVN